MNDPTQQVAEAAKAMHRARTRIIEERDWDKLDDRDREALCVQAAAAINALQLTEERESRGFRRLQKPTRLVGPWFEGTADV